MRQLLRSLSTRLIATHMLVAVSAMIIVGSALFVSALPIQRELVFQRLNDSLVPGLIFNPAIRPENSERRGEPRALPSRERLTQLLQDQAQSQQIRILIVNGSQHQVLFDSAQTSVGQVWDQALLREEMEPRRPWSFERMRLPRDRARGVVRLESARWLYVATPIAVDPATAPAFLIALQPRPSLGSAAVAMLSTFPPLLTLTTVTVLLAFIGLLSVWISRTVARSLSPVITGTEEIAAGNLGYRVSTDDAALHEVVALAHSFNHMAEQVEQSRQAQRDFIANVSHDLKTPLTSIQGFSQALFDGTASDPATQRRASQVIYSEVARMGALIDELLEMVRMDSSQLHLRRSPHDLNDFVQPLLESYRASNNPNHHEIHWRPAPEPLPVDIDPDRLARAVRNLLDNAFTHSTAGGAITVSTSSVQPDKAASTRLAEIAIADSGPGIPAADLPHIFERFYQVNKARSGKRGSGIGLSIAREIVTAHGGTIDVFSREDVGSRFRIRLPQATHPQPPVDPGSDDDGQRSPKRRYGSSEKEPS